MAISRQKRSDRAASRHGSPLWMLEVNAPAEFHGIDDAGQTWVFSRMADTCLGLLTPYVWLEIGTGGFARSELPVVVVQC